MNRAVQYRHILQTYSRHGWRLARVLASAGTFEELRREGDEASGGEVRFEGAPVEEAGVDAIWFKRPAQGGREAWELRLVGDIPYALFELFEPDEDEEDREQVRREMEAEMKERMGGAGSEGAKGEG